MSLDEIILSFFARLISAFLDFLFGVEGIVNTSLNSFLTDTLDVNSLLSGILGTG